MCQKVLVPLHMSGESDAVFGLVRPDLEPDGELILLHVISPGRTVSMGSYVLTGSPIEEDSRSNAMADLRGVVRRLGGGPYKWRCEVVVANLWPRALSSSPGTRRSTS